jgi:hypothetical protein
MTDSEKAIVEDILQLIQEYGDIQLKLWQERTTGMNYQPAAVRISQLIREQYYDTKTTSDMGEVR